jgi:hypothetical protein
MFDFIVTIEIATKSLVHNTKGLLRLVGYNFLFKKGVGKVKDFSYDQSAGTWKVKCSEALVAVTMLVD